MLLHHLRIRQLLFLYFRPPSLPPSPSLVAFSLIAATSAGSLAAPIPWAHQ